MLVADDDRTTRETAARLLGFSGIRTYEAATGAAAIAAVRAHRPDLALIDWRLPDMSGFEVVQAIRNERIAVPWILMSGFMDIDIAVEAGRQGALRAVSSPFDVERVVKQAFADIERRRVGTWPSLPLAPRLREPRSAAECWAYLVLKACDADQDLRTLDDWRLSVAVSYSRLRESCRLIGIQPHDARNFMRALRVLLHSGGQTAHLEAELDISDYRTRDELLMRAGLAGRHVWQTLSFEEFLLAQRFIQSDHPGLRAIRTLVADA